jgi:hypothetical protein
MQAMTQSPYSQEKNRLMSAYASITKRTYWFPLPGFHTPLELTEKRTRLEQDEFIVCVAGQLKAGKSTLLNALLFKDAVLPSFPTAMTAAITRIDHASRSPTGKEGFQAAFYSEEEWLNLKEKYTLSEAIESFEKDVDVARRAGVSEWDLFGREPQFHAGFDRLNEYVASMDNGGHYTPFVREATLYYNHPALRDLTIVDTPGTNDPNVVREAIATAYLSKADAVLFATYAGRILDQNDLSLLTRYLGHMDAARVIFVITKVDVPFGSRHELDGYINSDLRKVDALLSEMEAVGKLDTKGSVKLARYRELGFASAETAGIEPLRKQLETVLIQRKEETVLGSHRATLRTLINGRYRALSVELAKKRRLLEDTKKDSTTRATEHNEITALILKYQIQCESLPKIVSPQIGRLMNDFERHCQERAAKLPQEVADDMDFNSPKHIKERLAIVFKGRLDDLMTSLHSELGKRLDRYVGELRHLIQEELSKLDATFPIPEDSLNFIIAQAIEALPQLEMGSIMGEIQNTANRVYEGVYYFFERWFDTDIFSAKDARQNIVQQLQEVLETPEKSPVQQFVATVRGHLDLDVSSQIEGLLGNQIKDYLSRRGQDLERIAKTKADLALLKNEIEGECAVLLANLSEIKNDTALYSFLEEAEHA